MKTKRIKNSKSKAIIMSIILVIFVVYSITLLYPFAWMLNSSLKERHEFYFNVFGLPEKLKLSNYINAIFHEKVIVGSGANAREIWLVNMFLHSIIVTSGSTVAAVFFASVSAYVVCKYNFRGREFLYGVIIFAMVVPIVGSLPSMYMLMSSMKLIDTIPGVIFMASGGFGINFILLYGFYKSISWSYAEAAFVDGANDFSVYFKIMLPLAKPALIAVGIIAGIGYWNDYSTPSIFLRSYPTVAVGVNDLVKQMLYDNDYPLMFATMTVAIVPVIAVFALFQKTIMQNMIAGGLKG